MERNSPISSRWTESHTRDMGSLLLMFLYQVITLITAATSDGIDVGSTALSILTALQDRVKEKELKAAMFGIMKNGKSTMENNILRMVLCPEGVCPETAVILSIVHDPHATEPILNNITGRQLVHQFLQETNARLRNGENVPREYTVRCCVEGLRGRELGGVRVVLSDTPGVNDVNPVVDEMTRKVIQTADVLIVLVDISKLTSQDEHVHLSSVVSQRPDLLRDGRLIFLLNKIDLVHFDRVQIDKAQAMLSTFLRSIDPSLTTFSVYPLSTMSYALATCGLQGQVPPEYAATFRRTVFGEFMPPRPLDDPDLIRCLQHMQESSQFQEVEEVIFNRLTLQAPLLFTQSTLGQIQRCLSDVVLRMEMQAASLEGDERVIGALLGAFEEWKKGCADVERDVLAEVSELESQLTRSLQTVVERMRNTLKTLPPPSRSGQPVHYNTEAEAVEVGRRQAESLGSSIMYQLAVDAAQCETKTYDYVSAVKTKVLEAGSVKLSQVLHRSLAGNPLLDTFRQQLQQPTIWQPYSYSPKEIARDWIATDFTHVNKCEVTVTKQEAELVQPVFGTVTEDQENVVAGNKGRTSTIGAITGAILGGIAGLVIGGVCGNLFGRKQKSEVISIQKSIMKEPAKIVMKDVSVKEERYTVSEVEIHQTIVGKALVVVDGFSDALTSTAADAKRIAKEGLRVNLTERIESMGAMVSRTVAQHRIDQGEKVVMLNKIRGHLQRMNVMLGVSAMSPVDALKALQNAGH